jgi:hypothetical protein
MVETTHIELARECEAVDLERFVQELGLHARRDGTAIEIVEASNVIGAAVTEWLAEWRNPLVPTPLDDGALALRPPAG